jgi:formylglycine-generating enzyme required for sulfatase activity
LPTESEWEYACRAGSLGDYAGELKDTAWYAENSDRRTHPAGQKLLNNWGLADMRGNVWEWCEDWYHETYNGAPTDGSAWLSGGKQVARVLRGGSWGNAANIVRSGRYFTAPDFGGPDFGFRVVAVR